MDETNGYYYTRYIAEQRLTCESSIKRIFLNECIRRLHVMNGEGSPTLRMPVQYSKITIWHKVNSLMPTILLTERELLLQKVKRRLFLEYRKKPRKAIAPKRNTSNFYEAIYIKPLRNYWGVRRIPRKYLDHIEPPACEQSNLNHHLKRKLAIGEESTETISPLNLSKRKKKCQFCEWQNNMNCHHHHQPLKLPSMDEQIKRIPYQYQVHRVNRRALKVEEMVCEQQNRQLAATSDKYLEASIRSTLYMKTLIGILTTEQFLQHDFV